MLFWKDFMKKLLFRLFFVFACFVFGTTDVLADGSHTTLCFSTATTYTLPKEPICVYVIKQANSKNAEAVLKEWKDVIHLFKPRASEKYRIKELVQIFEILGIDPNNLCATRDLTLVVGYGKDEKAFGVYVKLDTINPDKVRTFFKETFFSKEPQTIVVDDLCLMIETNRTLVMKQSQSDVLQVAGVKGKKELIVGFKPTGIFKKTIDANVDVLTIAIAFEDPSKKQKDGVPARGFFKIYNRGLSLVGRAELEYDSEEQAKEGIKQWEKEKEKLKRIGSEALNNVLASLKMTHSGKKLIFTTKEISAFECYRIITELELREDIIR